ncbi:MAG TPA: glutamine-hydrolyzing carbamoyl-phosphate synthase small subunit [Bacteroidota bacterium]|nr:glutamine-hydrolyzing carbamoyl-phosphate synthase small subunit [Bacteroidota bacterium]
MTARLVLENGDVFRGVSFGADTETTGELVFNTSLTGYQEILTDPSYCGQIVTMTNPLIGNYGINDDDLESARPRVAGFVVREYSDFYSNHRARASLGSWLREAEIPAIQGVDTRMLTRIIRQSGAMRALISTGESDEKELLAKVLDSPGMTGLDLTREVTCREPYGWDDLDLTPYALPAYPGSPRFHVVVYDFGVKRNILRRLRAHGCRLTVVPADTPAPEVLAMSPDGVFLSNGPGDPDAVRYAVRNIGDLLGKKPIFGICLGHQLLALALGGRTYKLKFGHHGANHPVKNLLTGEIEITSQNHGFAVDPESLDPAHIEITHVNLNDGTNEGFMHKSLPAFSVQYHPEASPGPHDSDYLFKTFLRTLTGQAAIHAS